MSNNCVPTRFRSVVKVCLAINSILKLFAELQLLTQCCFSAPRLHNVYSFWTVSVMISCHGWKGRLELKFLLRFLLGNPQTAGLEMRIRQVSFTILYLYKCYIQVYCLTFSDWRKFSLSALPAIYVKGKMGNALSVHKPPSHNTKQNGYALSVHIALPAIYKFFYLVYFTIYIPEMKFYTLFMHCVK